MAMLAAQAAASPQARHAARWGCLFLLAPIALIGVLILAILSAGMPTSSAHTRSASASSG